MQHTATRIGHENWATHTQKKTIFQATINIQNRLKIHRAATQRIPDKTNKNLQNNRWASSGWTRSERCTCHRVTVLPAMAIGLSRLSLQHTSPSVLSSPITARGDIVPWQSMVDNALERGKRPAGPVSHGRHARQHVVTSYKLAVAAAERNRLVRCMHAARGEERTRLLEGCCWFPSSRSSIVCST